MKLFSLILVLFFSYTSVAQKLYFQGKVLFESIPLSQVEIINKNLKTVIKTDFYGNFKIPVEDLNEIIIHHEGYQDVFYTYKNDFVGEVTILLPKKAIEIELVVVDTERKEFEIKYYREYFEKNKLIQDGAIENGVDFVAIFKMLNKNKIASVD
jgi:hypothetical protein